MIYFVSSSIIRNMDFFSFTLTNWPQMFIAILSFGFKTISEIIPSDAIWTFFNVFYYLSLHTSPLFCSSPFLNRFNFFIMLYCTRSVSFFYFKFSSLISSLSWLKQRRKEWFSNLLLDNSNISLINSFSIGEIKGSPNHKRTIIRFQFIILLHLLLKVF